MGMVLTKIEDFRDNLDKMTRDELWRYAQANGVAATFPQGANTPRSDYTSQPAPNMVAILRSLNLRGIDKSREQLGAPSFKSDVPLDQVVGLKSKPEPEFNIATATRAQLAKEVKRRGIKMARTDSKEKLVERLNGENTA